MPRTAKPPTPATRESAWECAVCPAFPCAVCAPLSPIARREVSAAVTAVHVARGAQVPIADADGATIVASGLGLAERSLPDGRRQVVAFPITGELLCFGGRSPSGRHHRLVAVTQMTVCRLPIEVLLRLGRMHSALLLALLESACLEADRCADRLVAVGRMTAPERIAAFLLEMLERNGTHRTPTGAAVVALPMNREDIADYLGLNVETVSRTLSKFKREGVIRLPKPGRVVVDDPAVLEARVPVPRKPAPSAA